MCARQVPHVEQELLILPEHLSSSPVFSSVRVPRSLVFCVCFVDRCFVLFLLAIVLSVLLLAIVLSVLLLAIVLSVLLLAIALSVLLLAIVLSVLLLAIVLSVLLRFTDYDYPFGIIKLFINETNVIHNMYVIYVMIAQDLDSQNIRQCICH